MNLKEILCKCPKCGEQFAIGDALEQQAIEQVRAELASLNSDETQLLIEAEKTKAAEEAKKQAQEEILKQTKQKQDELETAQNKLNAIELEKITTDAKLKNIQQRQEAEIAIKLAEEKSKWDAEKVNAETALKLQVQKLQDDIKQASARAEQGSMQLQGEGGELAIEDTLRQMFPSDDVIEVKKGQRGADCILVVRNNAGKTVGKILFESKDTKSFSSDWITKLKSDAINEGAKIPILVTTAWPSDNKKAHSRDGVWITGFHEYQILTRALRQSLLDISKVTAAEENRGDKAQVMYNFLMSQEFSNTIQQMLSPIFRMHDQLQKEKRSITRLWKERETLIEGSISGSESLYMKIQGIGQVNLPPIQGLESIEDLTEE